MYMYKYVFAKYILLKMRLYEMEQNFIWDLFLTYAISSE